MKSRGKILSLLLAICLVVGLLPTMAFAANGDKAIMLGASHLKGRQVSRVYFGTYQQSDNGNGGYKTPTPSNGGCLPMMKKTVGRCSCFPTRTLTCFNIIRIMRASHGKRAPCAPGSTGTTHRKTSAAIAV